MITTRAATPDDADSISAIACEVQAAHAAALPDIFKPAGLETFPAATIATSIGQPGQLWWVATTDGAVVGYAYAVIQRLPETPWRRATEFLMLDQMGVRSDRRGAGIGSGLLRAVIDKAEHLGLGATRLQVWAFNDRARAFYRRHGFVEEQARLIRHTRRA